MTVNRTGQVEPRTVASFGSRFSKTLPRSDGYGLSLLSRILHTLSLHAVLLFLLPTDRKNRQENRAD